MVELRSVRDWVAEARAKYDEIVKADATTDDLNVILVHATLDRAPYVDLIAIATICSAAVFLSTDTPEWTI